MDMLEPSPDAGGQDKTNDSTESDDPVHLLKSHADGNQGTITIDPSVQYQFRTDTPQGQVTYRVVQVAPDTEGQASQIVTTNAFPHGAPVAQVSNYPAVIQSPFSNGGSPTHAEALGSDGTKFTYVPAVTAAGDAIVAAQSADLSAATASLGQVTTAGGEGQFYVMMSPQDVLQGQRTIAPRTAIVNPKIEAPRSTRDDRRRATHNEVERRRRDKINNWIMQLSKLVPDCAQDHAKQGQVVSAASKGGILAKACEYITELRTANARMVETLKDTERLSVDVELLRQQCEELKQENAMLRTQLQQHGLVPSPDLTGGAS